MSVRRPVWPKMLRGHVVICGVSVPPVFSARAADAPVLTLYSAQHEQTVDTLVSRLREGDRHPGSGAFGRRPGSRQPDHPGRRGLARRCLLHRELAGDRGAGREGAASPRSIPRRSRRSRPRTARPTATGSACSRARTSSPTTPSMIAASQMPAVADGPRRTGLEGPRRHRAERQRLPAAGQGRARHEGA